MASSSPAPPAVSDTPSASLRAEDETRPCFAAMRRANGCMHAWGTAAASVASAACYGTATARLRNSLWWRAIEFHCHGAPMNARGRLRRAGPQPGLDADRAEGDMREHPLFYTDTSFPVMVCESALARGPAWTRVAP